MKFLAFFILFSYSSYAFEIAHEQASPRLLSVMQDIERLNMPIRSLVFTGEDEWLVVTKNKRWYSNGSYFSSLKGTGNISLKSLVDNSMYQKKEILSVSISPNGNWVVIFRDGSFSTSFAKIYDDNGLIKSLKDGISRGAKPVKIFLGPRKSWVFTDSFKKIHTRGTPKNLRLLLKSIEESKQELTDIDFRQKNNFDFHWAVAAGSNFWKTGAPGSNLWNDTIEFRNKRKKITAMGLMKEKGYILISEKDLHPEIGTVLDKIELDVKFDNLINRMKLNKVPGLVLAHIKKGKIKEIRPYGFRRTFNWQIMNNETRFLTASLSKAVGSATFLKLAMEKEVIDRFNTVKDTLKNPKLLTGRYWYNTLLNSEQRSLIDDATLVSLTNHTSGLNIHGIGIYEELKLPSLRDVLLGRKRPEKVTPKWAPFTRYFYSGGAYTLLETILEETLEKEFWKIAKEQILFPAGMHNSTMNKLGISERGNFAEGHIDNTGLGIGYCPVKSAGGLFSTARDYSKFIMLLANNGKNSYSTVLEPDTIKEMFTPAAKITSSQRSCSQTSECESTERCIYNKCIEPIYDDLGFHLGSGLKLCTDRFSSGLPACVEHGGTQHGTNHEFKLYLKEKEAILILTNGDCDWKDSRGNSYGACKLIKEIQSSFSRNK